MHTTTTVTTTVTVTTTDEPPQCDVRADLARRHRPVRPHDATCPVCQQRPVAAAPVPGPWNSPNHQCDIDEIAVELAVRGELEGRHLNHCERREAVSYLRAKGYSLTETGEALRIPARSVSRCLEAMRKRPHPHDTHLEATA